MIRCIVLILACLIIAGIVHIGTILYASTEISKDFLEKTAQLGDPFAFYILARPISNNIILKGQDPNMTIGICRFSLAQKPLHIVANLGRFEWSMAVYNRQGFVYYSLNNRSVAVEQLNAIILKDSQINAIEQAAFSEQEEKLFISAPEEDGIVLLRLLTSSESERREIEQVIMTASCKPIALPQTQQLFDDIGNISHDDAATEPKLPPSRPSKHR